MTAAVWYLEWRQAARRTRVMVLSCAVPLLLVSAVSLGGAPPPHAALVYSVLFTFFGTFGAGIPWARDAERGLIHRLLLTGLNPWWAALQRWAASALLDLFQLMPSLAVIILVYRVDPSRSLALVGGVALGLFTANALGILVASAARSLAETALLASVAALVLLHAAGVFRTPPAGTLADVVQHAIPFHYMSEAIRAAVGAL